MNGALLLLQREPDWTSWIWIALFIVAPLVSRILKGLKKNEAEVESETGESPLERRRRLRQERRAAEQEGEEQWRRLARGEESARPPARAPLTIPTPPAQREATLEQISLEGAEEPTPLSVLGEVSEPAEAPEVSLEGAGEPIPLGALSRPIASEEPAAEPALARASFRLARGDLRRGILLSEILGPPVSERALRA